MVIYNSRWQHVSRKVLSSAREDIYLRATTVFSWVIYIRVAEFPHPDIAWNIRAQKL